MPKSPLSLNESRDFFDKLGYTGYITIACVLFCAAPGEKPGDKGDARQAGANPYYDPSRAVAAEGLSARLKDDGKE